MEINERPEIVLTDTQIAGAKPVETPFGTLRHLEYEEYLDLSGELGWIAQNTLHFYYMILKTIPKHHKEERKKAKEFKNNALRDIVLTYEQVALAYQQILMKMLDQNDFAQDPETYAKVIVDIFSQDESFLLIRDYIMKMNLLREEKVSPNPRLQEIFERDKEFNKVKFKDAPSSSDIIFTVASLSPNPLEKVMKMSPIQVHNIYARLSANKDYERNVLFATVSNEVEIESWAKKIDLFEVKDTSAISQAEYEQKYAGMFK